MQTLECGAIGFAAPLSLRWRILSFVPTAMPRLDEHLAPMDLAVELGRLRLPNPILVASGTFGYAREMEGLVDVARLGGILPKTITQEPRTGNAPWRTVETAAGMLNSI